MEAQRLDATDGDSEFLAPVAAQWYPTRSLRPEQRLMRAVLEHALFEFAAASLVPPTRPLERPDRHAVVAWFASCDRSWPFSFENICEAIDLDPARVRAGLHRLPRASARWL